MFLVIINLINLIKQTISDLLPIEGEKIRIMEGAKQNLPDKDAVHAATKIIDVCNLASDGDLLIVLISGGMFFT